MAPLLAAYCLLPAAYCLLRSADCLAAGRRYEVREIKPKVFVWIPEDILEIDGDPEFSRAGTAGFILTDEGAVVVNTTNSPFHAREVLYEIRHRTDQPVKDVIDTNWTGDLVLGNEVFVELGSAIISTSAAQAAMRQYEHDLSQRAAGDPRVQTRMRGFHVRLPDQTFDREIGLVLGGREIRVLSTTAGDSPGDAAVYLPAEKVLFLGDLFQNGYFPSLDSRDIHHWIEALGQIESWDAEMYVPGHGEPAGKKEVSEFRQFLEWLTTEVQTRIQGGKTLDQVKGELVPLQKYQWRAPELASGLVEAVYQQLAAVRRSAGQKRPTTLTTEPQRHRENWKSKS